MKPKKVMLEKIGEPAMYEQLAEECIELAHACLKKARFLRGENPTPRSLADINLNITEEWTDVCMCTCELNIGISTEIWENKAARFLDRWNGASEIVMIPVT